MKIIIVTHNGTAHTDERLACGMLYAHFCALNRKQTEATTFEVVRTRDFENIDKGAVAVFYIDVSMKYDGRIYFDHHQDEPAVDGECSATLIAKTFHKDIVESDHPFNDYLKRVAKQDINGLNAVMEDYGRASLSPLLFEEFEANKRFETDPVGEMIQVSETILRIKEEVKIYEDLCEWAEGKLEVHSTKAGNVLVWNEESEELYKSWPDLLMRRYSYVKIAEHNAVAVVGLEFRNSMEGTVFRFYRTANGEEILDFRKWQSDNNGRLKFCHKNGFLLLVMNYTAGSWKKIIEKSII